MNKLEKNKNYSNQSFEDIKHIDENGIEYWYARELQLVLDYKEWRKFEGLVQRAMKACENSDINALDHFGGADKMVQILINSIILDIKVYIMERLLMILPKEKA